MICKITINERENHFNVEIYFLILYVDYGKNYIK